MTTEEKVEQMCRDIRAMETAAMNGPVCCVIKDPISQKEIAKFEHKLMGILANESYVTKACCAEKHGTISPMVVPGQVPEAQQCQAPKVETVSTYEDLTMHKTKALGHDADVEGLALDILGYLEYCCKLDRDTRYSTVSSFTLGESIRIMCRYWAGITRRNSMPYEFVPTTCEVKS